MVFLSAFLKTGDQQTSSMAKCHLLASSKQRRKTDRVVRGSNRSLLLQDMLREIRMPRKLSLHHLCAMEIDAETLVNEAAQAGFAHVCLFVESPEGMGLELPLVTENRCRSLRARMDDVGITTLNVDAFALGATTDIAGFEAAFAVSAEVGAQSCTVVVTDPIEARAINNFGLLCELAAGYGICPGIEFMEFTPVDNLQKASRIVRQAGHSKGKLTLDLLHFIRNGVPIEAIDGLPDQMIGYLQLCDGASVPPTDRWDEAVCNRMIPGKGGFPIGAFLDAIPSFQPVALEVPLENLRLAGMSAHERVTCLAEAMRHYLKNP